MLAPELLGAYINPDEIEKTIRDQGILDFHKFDIDVTHDALIKFLSESTLLQSASLLQHVPDLHVVENTL